MQSRQQITTSNTKLISAHFRTLIGFLGFLMLFAALV